MEPTTEGATMFPAIRTTKRSPNPWSKRISTGVRESEQPSTIANGRVPHGERRVLHARSVSGGIAEATVSFEEPFHRFARRRGFGRRAGRHGLNSTFKTRSGSVIIAPCSNRSPPPHLRDRYRGALLGLAVGNTLGLPVEGWPREEIRRRYPGGVREIDALEMTLPWDDDLARR